MHIHERVRVDDGAKAFEILTSRNGAESFRDIGTYTEYSATRHKIRVAYATFFGATRIVLNRQGPERIAFSGTGPCGVSFEGHWTRRGNDIVLDQTVSGIPSLASGIVETRIRRAMDDLVSASSS